MNHASRITHHVSRFTHHVSRFTHHASRFTQHGFTLLELLATIAIITLVTGMLVMILYQIVSIPRWGNAQLTVDGDLRNAGLWLMRDGNESRVFSGTAPCNSFTFDTGRGTVYTYTLSGSTLSRSNGGQTIGVARHVSGLQCPSGPVTGTVAISLTATSGSVSGSAVFTVTMRVQ